MTCFHALLCCVDLLAFFFLVFFVKGAIRGGVFPVRPPEEAGRDAGVHGAQPPDRDGAGQAGGGDY